MIAATPAFDLGCEFYQSRYYLRNDPVVECFGTNTSCLILPACGLRAPLAEAQEAFFATLDRYTLADVTHSRHALGALLEA